jgi:tetratricopeptide (TPR) repeat protein
VLAGCSADETKARQKLTKGRAALNKEHYKAAIPYCSQALTLNERYDSAYYVRAKAYEGLKRYDAALVDLDSALHYNPDYKEAYYLRAKILLERGDQIGGCNDLEMARLRGHARADSLQEEHDCPPMLEQTR